MVVAELLHQACVIRHRKEAVISGKVGRKSCVILMSAPQWAARLGGENVRDENSNEFRDGSS
ncbi:MAG: hypothetical protein WBL40_16995 [Terrimicrobiaceae bacterium]